MVLSVAAVSQNSTAYPHCLQLWLWRISFDHSVPNHRRTSASIVSSHAAKIQTSREHCRKWVRLQNFILAGPFNPIAHREKKIVLYEFWPSEGPLANNPFCCCPTYEKIPDLEWEENSWMCKNHIQATNKRRKLPSQILDSQGTHECIHEIQ